MSEEQIVVVAAPGHQVILTIVSDTYTIDSYHPVNLSNYFSYEELNKCTGLQAHLEDGNLIYYKEGNTLPKNPFEVKIKPLKETVITKIETPYKQKTRTKTNAKHVEMDTETDISEEQKQDIQQQVIANRDKILSQDKKILKKQVNDNIVTSSSRNDDLKRGVMSKSELALKVEMDVDPDKFQEIQNDTRAKLEKGYQASNEVDVEPPTNKNDN